jgi:hypothetical protein
MHIVKENETIASSSNIGFENRENLFVDSFMLGIADGVFPVIALFAIIVETECTGSNVDTGGNLREKTVAEKGFA